MKLRRGEGPKFAWPSRVISTFVPWIGVTRQTQSIYSFSELSEVHDDDKAEKWATAKLLLTVCLTSV